jgi:hypothetical protein
MAVIYFGSDSVSDNYSFHTDRFCSLLYDHPQYSCDHMSRILASGRILSWQSEKVWTEFYTRSIPAYSVILYISLVFT